MAEYNIPAKYMKHLLSGDGVITIRTSGGPEYPPDFECCWCKESISQDDSDFPFDKFHTALKGQSWDWDSEREWMINHLKHEEGCEWRAIHDWWIILSDIKSGDKINFV